MTHALCFQAAFHITSELQMIIRLLQTPDNIVRNQELKYSEGPRPPLRGGMTRRGRGRETGVQEPLPGVRPPPSQAHAAPQPWRVLTMIDTCCAEGKDQAAIGSTVVFICTLSEAAMWLLIQKKKKKN